LALFDACSNTTDDTNSTTRTTTAETIVQRERSLTGTALQKNPKAYGAWFHRKWTLQRFRPPTNVLREELGLTEEFLRADERNFHCWNYRRFVVACLGGSWDGEWRVEAVAGTTTTTTTKRTNVLSLMGQQVVQTSEEKHESQRNKNEDEKSIVVLLTNEEQRSCIPEELISSEFEFTTSKIEQNFSNFSAFHYRSQLLDLCCGNNNDDDDSLAMEKAVLLEGEFKLVEDAVCTEPDDQTCWWYHAILLDKLLLATETNKNDNDNKDSVLPLVWSELWPTLFEQADLFREILEDSPNSKWVILGLFRVLEVLGAMAEASCSGIENDSSSSSEERESLLDRLIEIDPYRCNRYRELKEKKTQVEETKE